MAMGSSSLDTPESFWLASAPISTGYWRLMHSIWGTALRSHLPKTVIAQLFFLFRLGARKAYWLLALESL